jgi:hypothetical protein
MLTRHSAHVERSADAGLCGVETVYVDLRGVATETETAPVPTSAAPVALLGMVSLPQIPTPSLRHTVLTDGSSSSRTDTGSSYGGDIFCAAGQGKC